MELAVILALVVPMIVGLAVVALVVGLLVSRSRATPAAASAPAVLGPSAWHAQLGAGPGATYGVLHVWDGWLAFTPDGAAEPAWTVPCAQVLVGRQGVGPFTLTAVRLHGPMGEIGCNVSREHINRFMTNSLKSFRESGYADQFVAAVQAQGARVG